MEILVYFLIGLVIFVVAQVASTRWEEGEDGYAVCKIVAWVSLPLWPLSLITLLSIGFACIVLVAVMHLDTAINNLLRRKR